MKVFEGNYCNKLCQIGAIGLVKYYSFTPILSMKIKHVMLLENKELCFIIYIKKLFNQK